MALFVPDEHQPAAIQGGEAAHDREVVAEIAIPAKRHEILERMLYVVAEMRPGRMPRYLRLLPRGERGIGAGEQFGALGF